MTDSLLTGAKVYMLGRSKERTEAAAKEVLEKTKVGEDMVQVMLVDLASLQSVREFGAAFKQSKRLRFYVQFHTVAFIEVNEYL